MTAATHKGSSTAKTTRKTSSKRRPLATTKTTPKTAAKRRLTSTTKSTRKTGAKKASTRRVSSAPATMRKSASKKASTRRVSSAPATMRKSASKKTASASRVSASTSRSAPLKDPKGGLTAAGRRAFNARDGSHLKPGVTGPADTPEKMRRKGSFLRRHFATLRGPLVDDAGKPTRLALSAHAWGEPVPKTVAAASKLAEKGTRLLERYRRSKSRA